ncbi:MAG TPA: NADH-quinone oxidoreductase subunit C [Acetobacteraceae bacterium]|nr:NADH-quinone oxidoreductase subunit C [Acetobacteraceae bacterium]
MRGTALTDIAPDGLRPELERLLAEGGRAQMVYAWYPNPDRLELRYLASAAARESFRMWRCTPEAEMPSLADLAPLLGWYEREIMDLFGLPFRGHPEPHRLVLHEGVPPAPPPFSPAACGEALVPEGSLRHRIPAIEAPEVQELPFGPVRADVFESAEFLFFYLGERIIYYQPSLFFKHRGMEKRFEGRAPAAGVVLAERVSGVGSFAHALAYCQAVEAAAECAVPPRATALRVLLTELERLYNHLHYLGHLAGTTTLKVGEAQGKLLEERAKQINSRLTGSRFLRSLLTPGGLRRDLDPKPWLATALEALREDIAEYTKLLEHSESYLDRLIGTGILEREVAFDQGATGPVDRASGVDRDLRRDHPYAAYDVLDLEVPVEQAGDADARAKVRVAEIGASLALMQRVLLLLPEGPVAAPAVPAPGSEGLGWAESPRGTLFYAVHVGNDGKLARVKIKSPSFSNWRCFPFTVHDTNMMDYAINEASFGLTIAGCDR